MPRLQFNDWIRKEELFSTALGENGKSHLKGHITQCDADGDDVRLEIRVWFTKDGRLCPGKGLTFGIQDIDNLDTAIGVFKHLHGLE